MQCSASHLLLPPPPSQKQQHHSLKGELFAQAQGKASLRYLLYPKEITASAQPSGNTTHPLVSMGITHTGALLNSGSTRSHFRPPQLTTAFHFYAKINE